MVLVARIDTTGACMLDGYTPQFRSALISRTGSDKRWRGYPLFGSFAAFCGITIDITHEDGTFSLFRSSFARNASSHLHFAAFRLLHDSPVARVIYSVHVSPSNTTTRVLVSDPLLARFFTFPDFPQDDEKMRIGLAELAFSDPRVKEGGTHLRVDCVGRDSAAPITCAATPQRLRPAVAFALSFLALSVFLGAKRWRGQRSEPEKSK
jgi:hypothetical protein